MMLLAGSAAFDITPSNLPLLQGHYCLDPAVGVLSPVEGRALVLDDGLCAVAIITLDVLGVTLAFTQRVRQRIEQQTAIPGDHVLIAASHTHCAPVTLPCLGHLPEEDWLRSVEDKAVAAVVNAADTKVGVTLSVGQASADFNINRRPLAGSQDMTVNYGGINDRRVRVLKVDQHDGKPLATAFHYACHPTAKSGSDRWISPDYPGYARKAIEAQRGGHALFLPGCFANIRPEIRNNTGGFGSATPTQLEDIGNQLACAVALAADRSATLRDPCLAAATIPVQYRYGPLPDKVKIQQWRDYSSKPGTINLFPLIERVEQLRETDQIPKPLESELQRIELGGLTLLAIGGEPALEIGLALEKMQTQHESWAMGYCNDMVGYLCTEQQKLEGGYEPNAFGYFGQPAAFADEQDIIQDCMKKHAI